MITETMRMGKKKRSLINNAKKSKEETLQVFVFFVWRMQVTVEL